MKSIIKCMAVFMTMILFIISLSSCQDSGGTSQSKKDQVPVSSDITNGSDKEKTKKDNNKNSKEHGDIVVYAGPGTDYYCEGTINLTDINGIVLEDHGWVEILYNDKQHGYITKDTIKERDFSNVPVLASTIPVEVEGRKYLQRISFQYRLSGDIDLFEDTDNSNKSFMIEKGNVVTVIAPMPLKENKYHIKGIINSTEKETSYWLIEVNTERGKERAYVGARDLFDLDNPLKDFSSVKKNNLKVVFGGETFYSSSDDDNFNDYWETIQEFNLSHTEINLWDGFWKVASSTDISLEDIGADPDSKVVGGIRVQLPTLSKGKETYSNTYTAIGEDAAMAADAWSALIWLAQKELAWMSASKQTQSFHVLLQECKEENRMVIYTGSPIESIQGGKYYGKEFSLLELLLDDGYTLFSAIETIDNTIRGLDPSFNGKKNYSMKIKFAEKGKDESPYGMRIIIDKEGNAFGNFALHKGTKFIICYDNKEIKDITPDIKSYLYQLNEKKARVLFDLLDESGFEIIKREAVAAVEEHSDAINYNDRNKIDNTYIDTIEGLVKKYGSLRIVQNNGEWQNEANGLCYLNLIDFTGDGKEELMAVCKNEDEEHYTGYIYTIKDGSVELLYENPIIEYNFFQGFDVVNLGYTADTGYVFGIGWEDADADDMTFFWYKDGKFEPVYRYNGYWDGDLDDEVIYEESIIVDIFDDDHRDEYYNNSPSVTLRTMSDINVDGDDFSLDDLQRNIDIVIQKLEGDSNTSNVERTEKPSINEDVNYDEFTMEEFGIPYGHYYGGKPQGEGVFGLDLDLYDDMTFSIQSSFDLFSDEDGDEYSYIGTYKIDRIDDDGNPVLLLHCDEGDYEFVWDGEQLLHDPVFAWYEGESSIREDENSDNSSDEDYQDVINEYKTAYNDFEQYREDPSAFMEKYPLVNANALIEPYLSSIDLTFFSAIKDINGDDVDELILGVDAEHPNSIYTFYGDQIIPLINDIGERSFINVYDDGTIYRYDSGGAAFGIATIYEINESGDGLNTIKQFEVDWDRDPDYPYYDGTDSLSQEQFNAEYLDKNEMEFHWSE